MGNIAAGFKEKQAIRKEILAARDAIGEEERRKADRLLTERILGHPWFCGAEVLLCFVSFGSEISTDGILEEGFQTGRKVYVPKVTRGMDKPEMEFYRITSRKKLTAGYRGIPEPAGDSERYVYSEGNTEHTLMLMPGVAFDGYRNRLGYGMGFYDRYLADKPGLWRHTIAVGYQCQVTGKLPSQETDIRPCQVICV